jgi:antitoxin (DNA-binding transcriptional repressor) of toxin-antitoxin stability system
MATTVNMHQAKTELSDLVARAEAGEETSSPAATSRR